MKIAQLTLLVIFVCFGPPCPAEDALVTHLPNTHDIPRTCIHPEPAGSPVTSQWIIIPVSPVYVPDPPGVFSIVGRYECPLTLGDKDALKNLTISYFESQKISIVEQGDAEGIVTITAMKGTNQSSEIAAYNVRINLALSPYKPAIHINNCNILLDIRQASFRPKDDGACLWATTQSNDVVASGLTSAINNFATEASRRQHNFSHIVFPHIF